MDNSGFILINKPVGPTSHDIVNKLRKITGIKKIGHAGTLDPFASGLLILAIGREATKNISNFVKLDKEYLAAVHLGGVSDTYDRTGKIIEIGSSHTRPDINKISEVIKSFIGEIKQVPPMYSAKKVDGKKLYKLARAGVMIERESSQIKIESIDIEEYNYPFLNLRIRCSSGTYIRSLANDIGEVLGCGAYLEELKRTAIGGFDLENAVDLNYLDEKNWPDFLFV